MEILSYDIVFVLTYTKILPNNFIKGNKLVLLVHESDLPEGEVFLFNGRCEVKIVVSLIEMTQEVDAVCMRQTMIEFDGTIISRNPKNKLRLHLL